MDDSNFEDVFIAPFKSSDTLIQFFQNCFIQERFIDFVIECDGGVQIKAHKLILASKSPSRIAQMHGNILSLRHFGVEPDAVREMVRYVYFGSAKTNDHVTPDMLREAAALLGIDEFEESRKLGCRIKEIPKSNAAMERPSSPDSGIESGDNLKTIQQQVVMMQLAAASQAPIPPNVDQELFQKYLLVFGQLKMASSAISLQQQQVNQPLLQQATQFMPQLNFSLNSTTNESLADNREEPDNESNQERNIIPKQAKGLRKRKTAKITVKKNVKSLLSPTKGKNGTCPLCGKLFMSIYNVTRHLKDVHGSGQNDNDASINIKHESNLSESK